VVVLLIDVILPAVTAPVAVNGLGNTLDSILKRDFECLVLMNAAFTLVLKLLLLLKELAIVDLKPFTTSTCRLVVTTQAINKVILVQWRLKLTPLHLPDLLLSLIMATLLTVTNWLPKNEKQMEIRLFLKM
jgi:hypothetical protein